MRDGEAEEPPADCVIDIADGASHSQLSGFIEGLAVDLDRRRHGRADFAPPSAGGPVSYVLCDSNPDNLGNIPYALDATLGRRRASRFPLTSSAASLGSVREGEPLPSLILIDDQCRFSEKEAGRKNAARVMAGLTRLFDAFAVAESKRPACVLFTNMNPGPARQLTFMEFGGHAFADRDLGDEHCAEVARDAIRAAQASEVAWSPPTLHIDGLLAPQTPSGRRASRSFLSLCDDRGSLTKARVDGTLGVDSRTLTARMKALQRQLQAEEARLLPPDPTGSALVDEEAIVHRAQRLGITWVVRESLRVADNFDWYGIVPPGARAPAELQLRSTRTPSMCERWFSHPDDPRRNPRI